jgi:hypothetical protein
MASKQVRPHSPEGTRLEGPDKQGTYTIIIPSESRAGKEHTLAVAYDGTPLACSCEGHATWLKAGGRNDCWHMPAAADLLAYHLDPPPADPGGAGGGPPELAGLAECEDAARDERKRRFDESMANLYGN